MARSANSQSGLVKAASGLIAGAVATGPMTVAMTLWHRRLPPTERNPLPPRDIVEKVTRAIGSGKEFDEAEKAAITMVAHFAYGSLMGLIYALFSGKVKAAAVVKGIFFGLIVWAGNYLGLLPMAGILKPVTQRPDQRNLLLIGAHIVWGASLGRLAGLLSEEFKPAPGQRSFTSRFASLKAGR